MYFIVIHVENIIYFKKGLNHLKKKKKKCITDIEESVKNRWLITAQVIKIKTMILWICITLLIETFSVIIVSKIKLWFNWYSFHSLINFDMHDRFWQVSDTMGMPISQKLWIKLRMDGWVRVLHPFNSISIISRRWKGEHEMLCAMKRRLGSGRISPPAGLEPATPWSEVGSANRSATRTLH